MRGSKGFLAAVLLALALAGPVSAQFSAQELRERREGVAARVGEGMILAMGSAQPPQDYISFFQNSPFRYLTNFTEPNAALLVLVRGGVIQSETLWVNPRDPSQETWEGYRVGPAGAMAATGIPGRSVLELPQVLDSLVGAGWDRVALIGPYQPGPEIQNDVTQRVDALLARIPGVTAVPATSVVAQLRQIKSPAELEQIRRATTITVQAHREILGTLAPGMNEFEIQGLVEYTFRRYGAERPAFATIVGSGRNSTVLHYNANDRFMEAGDVVVVDIGASYAGYSADITRTLPVSGRFSDPQREIYQLVRAAQDAAEALARPGVPVAQLNQAAAMTLAEGLVRLGLIESVDATYEGENGRLLPQYFLYYMHSLGHGIGLDVHDPWPNVLQPGVPFTIEPGIYVRENLFTEVVPDTPRNRRLRDAVAPAFERYRNIGVRIEDDFIVTDSGLEWISPAPREIEEIEALMARDAVAPTPRNPAWVEWYRGLR